MIFNSRDCDLGLLAAFVVAIAVVVANSIPSWEPSPPDVEGNVNAKKETYGWPFVDHWTNWYNRKFPFRGGDLQTHKFGLVEPEWVVGADDDDGKAFGYNRFVGVLAVSLVWILAASACSVWRRNRLHSIGADQWSRTN